MSTIIGIVFGIAVLGGGYFFVTNKKVQSRTKARVRGVGEGLADGLGDIVDDRKEGIIAREKKNVELRGSLAKVLAQINKTKEDAQGAIEEAEKYSGLVDEAIASEDDNAASDFMEAQESQEEIAESLTKAVESLEVQFEDLKAQLDESYEDVKDAKRETATFEARHTALELRKQMSDKVGAFDVGGGLDFSEQDEALRQQERELEANEQLATSSIDTSVTKFEKSAKRTKLARKLAARKAKLNGESA